jgi:hypothetical protein
MEEEEAYNKVKQPYITKYEADDAYKATTQEKRVAPSNVTSSCGECPPNSTEKRKRFGSYEVSFCEECNPKSCNC